MNPRLSLPLPLPSLPLAWTTRLARLTLAFALAVAVATSACGGAGGGQRVPPTSGGAGGDGGSGGGGNEGSGPPDVKVSLDVADRHQTLAGFGGAVAFYTNFLSARTDDIFTVLFNDLGIDILRVGNWYQNQAATGTSAATPFSDTATVAIVQKASAALGHAPKILMSSWSPPAYLKSNATTKGTPGTLLQTGGVYQYPQFADWWVRSLAAYAAQGVVPDYISLQNEPDFFNAGWETCQFVATESTTNAGYGRALDAVASAIAGSTLDAKPQIIGPEITGLNLNATRRYLTSMTSTAFFAMAHHLYNGGAAGPDPAPDSFTTPMTNVAGVAVDAGKPIFMTEFSPTSPSLLNTAWLIHNALTIEGVSAYIYWGLIWAPPAAGAAPGGLVTIAAADPTSPYTINDTYYAMKHFARWTDPGWTRVAASADVAAIKASAFVSPDGTSLTVVLLNTDTADHVLGVDNAGFAFGTASLYRTSGTSERAAAVPFDGSTIPLPAGAIATLVLAP